jgi:hypothetical protein
MIMFIFIYVYMQVRVVSFNSIVADTVVVALFFSLSLSFHSSCVTALTIEPDMAAYPNAPNKDVRRPIRGILTTFGYTIPDPTVPNRHSVWFTGGRLEPNNNPVDQREWKYLFTLHPPKPALCARAMLLYMKICMATQIPAEEIQADGSIEYSFKRPVGGHGVVYIDTVYMDGSLRIAKGARGTMYTLTRLS